MDKLINRLDEIQEELPGARIYKRADGTKYVAGVCPYHEDTRPSLLVFEDNLFHCQACGRWGNHITLLNELRQKGSTGVFRERKSWKTPNLPTTSDGLRSLINSSHTLLADNKSLQVYLEDRGLDGRIEPNRIGYYTGWYTVPVRNIEGDYEGLCLRAGPVVQKATGERFIVPPGQKPMMFVPDWKLFNNAPSVFIVFGLFDALTLVDLRYPVCTSTSGKDSFRAEWLDGYIAKRFIVIPDRGEEDTAIKLVRKIGLRANTHFLSYPEGIKDPNDFFQKGKRVDLDNALRGVIK